MLGFINDYTLIIGAYFYFYEPGVAVNRFGGGIIIPLSSEFGQ